MAVYDDLVDALYTARKILGHDRAREVRRVSDGVKMAEIQPALRG